MAEVVNRNVEAMLPELEDFVRRKIFDPHEVRVILKRRTRFEYRLRRRIVKKVDFIRYIEYEGHVDRLRKARRKSRGVTGPSTAADFAIVGRIYALYQRATRKFKGDIRLWRSYVKFCEEQNAARRRSRVLDEALKYNPHNTGLWILAVKSEFRDGNMKEARQLMLQALRVLPKSKKLWLEYFRLELLHVDKIRKRRQVISGDVEEKIDDVASVVYRLALKTIPDNVAFHLSFLEVYRLFDFTQSAVDQVYVDLLDQHSTSVVAQESVALRPLAEQRSFLTGSARVKIEEECSLRFETAVLSLPTEEMWSSYCSFCLKCLQFHHERKFWNGVKPSFSRALRVFDQALKDQLISAKMAVECVQLYSSLGDLARTREMLQSLLALHKGDVNLWLLHIQLLGEEDDVPANCRKAIKLVPVEDRVKLWGFLLDWTLTHQPDDVEDVFQNAISSCPRESADSFKEQYVDWACLSGGPKKARHVYQRLIALRPISSHLFEKCIAVEKGQAKPSLKCLRRLYEAALEEYGSSRPDLWLDLMDLEEKSGKVSEVSHLHWRAQQCLDSQFLEELNYQLMKRRAP